MKTQRQSLGALLLLGIGAAAVVFGAQDSFIRPSSSMRAVRPPAVRLAAQAKWGSPGWNWGSAQGAAHDLAGPLRARLQAQDQRLQWLERLRNGEVDWEEAKLSLALLFQKAAHERRDGGPLGYPLILTRLVEAVYESADGDAMLVSDMEARLVQFPDGGDQSGDADLWRRTVAASVFKELGFVRGGL
mmetsp:Transcript_28070/g.45023  ORF Transcript_28070/g.45023 Transcript_28070/m.45023 type:complete len:188 (-) Transcript_28070:96-659(-)